MSESRPVYTSKAEGRRRESEVNQKRRADPEYRERENARRRERQRELRADPEYRERERVRQREWRARKAR